MKRLYIKEKEEDRPSGVKHLEPSPIVLAKPNCFSIYIYRERERGEGGRGERERSYKTYIVQFFFFFNRLFLIDL